MNLLYSITHRKIIYILARLGRQVQANSPREVPWGIMGNLKNNNKSHSSGFLAFTRK